MNLRYLLLALLFTAASCGNNPEEQSSSGSVDVPDSAPTISAVEKARETYDVAHHFPGDQQDTLLANMITFIYKRPTTAINRDRTLPEFRSYYVDKLPLFNHVYHQVDGEDRHWFYLIRPARSVDGDKRGVGGWFTTNEALEMVEFVELFNTRIMPENELLDKGLQLFEHMVATGDVESHPLRNQWVEWPDERLKYDREKREWRYVD